MVPKIHRRAGSSGVSNAQHSARVGRNPLRRGAVAAVLASTTALSLSAVSADAAVTGGESIEVFTGSNLISLTSYPAGEDVRVEVLRQGVVIGSAVKTTDPDGAIEMNHVGAEADDCFEGDTSPDVMPGDTIRTTVVSNPANRDTSVVRGVWIDDIQYDVPTANDITLSGRVTLGTGPAAVRPGVDVLELRINKDSAWDGTGRIDKREDIGASVNPNGSWSHVMSGSVADVDEAEASSETFLEWSSGAAAEADFPPELTVGEFGPGEALPGCPPLQQGPTAPALLASMDSGTKGDHITNVATNLTFRGLAGPDADDTTVEPGANAEVELHIDDRAPLTADAAANGVYRFDVASLSPGTHRLMVRARDAGGAFFSSAVRVVKVDTVMPVAEFRRLAPKPLHLAGPERLRAVFRLSEAAQLQATVEKVSPNRTVKRFAVRNVRSAGLVEYLWNGKTATRRDVRPGLYRMVLTPTDAAGNQSTERVRFRVVR
ncbi:MAG: Ig-like domain-containing protein [Actinomycetota bacterium]|nr:Ig-like domain-containing protein [Actinomycetota bacterium]